MESIIIYGTKHGSAHRVAMAIAYETTYPVISHEEVTSLEDFDRIIYIGGIYPKGLPGLKETAETLFDFTKQELIIITVGITDPTDADNQQWINKRVRRQLPRQNRDAVQIYHAFGAIDYDVLDEMDQHYLEAIVRRGQSLEPEERSAEQRDFIRTYESRTDRTHENDLEKIAEAIQ